MPAAPQRHVCVRRRRYWWGACAAVLLVVTLAIGIGWHRQQLQRRHDAHWVVLWQQYQAALAQLDVAGIEAILPQLQALDPHNPAVQQLADAWQQKRSTPESLDLAAVLMLYHLQRSELAAAQREAEQLLQRQPRDWLAHCVRLHGLLNDQQGDTQAQQRAVSLWKQFPDPEDEQAQTTPAGLLYALRLANWLEQDDAPLRRAIERRVLPLLSAPRFLQASPMQQLQLVECFLAVAELPDSASTLPSRWAAVEHLVTVAVDHAQQRGDCEALRYWLALAPALERVLSHWQQTMPLRFSAQRLEPIRQQLRRLRRDAATTWRTVEPQQPEAYLQLAELAWLEQQVTEAFQHYIEALRRCSEPETVWERFLPFLSRYGSLASLKQVAQSLWQQAEARGEDTRLWLLAAQAAMAVQEYELAVQACQRVRRRYPGQATACWLEAQLWLRSGAPGQAQKVLEAVESHIVCRHDELARLYGRCLAAGEVAPRVVPQRYQELFSTGGSAAASFLRGVGQQTASVELLRWALRQARQGAVPGAAVWCRCYAELSYRLAETLVRPHPSGGPAIWETDAVAEALAAFALLTPQQRREPDLLLARATLYAFGCRQVEEALRLVKPLCHQSGCTGPHRLGVAYILLANRQAQQALELLDSDPGIEELGTAALWIARAWAYQELRQPVQALAAYRQAEALPGRTAREQADLVTLKSRLQREFGP
jgi:predicted Zn-dependent protease